MAAANVYYGSLFWQTTAGTTTVTNTPTKALGSTAGGENFGFSLVGDNRLVYDGAVGRCCMLMCTFSISSSGATNSTMHLAKNGALIAGANIQRKISTGGDIGAGAIHTLVCLKKDDYVELWVETDGGDTLTIQDAQLSVSVVG